MRLPVFFLTLVLLFAGFKARSQYVVQVIDSTNFTTGKGVILNKTSFRGLSVVDDQTIWVSGSRGTFARSTDGGETFTFTQLSGYEKSDFRDIEAFDDKRAVMMSSGTLAYILKTTDGGQTWKEVYKNKDTTYFLDAMDFWDDKRGMLVGDPRNGHFVLLQTTNGGETWQELDTAQTPVATNGEAVFAASGTSLRCWGKNKFGFVTGGAVSKIYLFKSNQLVANAFVPIAQGNPSKGAFSFCFSGSCYIAGGDYLFSDSTHNIHVLGKSMKVYALSHFDYPYLSCIESMDRPGEFMMTGPEGVFTLEKPVSAESFNVVRKAKKGKAVFLAGPKGKIGKLLR